MTEHILFLTGKLAEKRLRRVLEEMHPDEFSYEIKNMGISVAALMTAEMICRRLQDVNGADKILVPGLCRGDLEEISNRFGVPAVRGPVDLKDIPAFFGRKGNPPDLSRHAVRIFAEIVEAPMIGVPAILDRARAYRDDGADVIDIGCLPDTAFPHLEEAVQSLKQAGYSVSVDSLEEDELVRGGKAGADYLLSLNESSLWIADEVESTPVLIPEKHTDLASLYRSIEKLKIKNKPFIADSVLDPIHFGFTESIFRYHELRKRYPDIDIMMGIGNITELTEADTTGINAVLFGIISELGITSVLTTEVSPHACSAVREADKARRMMHAAKREDSLPKGIDSSLLTTHSRKPFPYTLDEIRELSEDIRDPSYRVQISREGIHVFNRDGLISADDPFELFPKLKLLEDDAPHAFYMGVELAKAQIAWQLGKRYMQDEELDWGAAVGRSRKDKGKTANGAADDRGSAGRKKPGSTLRARKKKRKKKT